ncbi:hypothetical protein EAI_13306 [Harpegnathos saltator]|uniref:Uncharacterized protein n=1 Tax=Harpegnathos saltator TaxID=610380 RepID=E2C2M8_HARSA|nr:hypothetical protein EAI_13306 [Harpegnathos saltator]
MRKLLSPVKTVINDKHLFIRRRDWISIELSQTEIIVWIQIHKMVGKINSLEPRLAPKVPTVCQPKASTTSQTRNVHTERVELKNRKLLPLMFQINAADARLYAVEQLRRQLRPSLKQEACQPSWHSELPGLMFMPAVLAFRVQRIKTRTVFLPRRFCRTFAAKFCRRTGFRKEDELRRSSRKPSVVQSPKMDSRQRPWLQDPTPNCTDIEVQNTIRTVNEQTKQQKKGNSQSGKSISKAAGMTEISVR